MHGVVTVARATPHVHAEETDIVLEAVAAIVDDVVKLGERDGAVLGAAHPAARALDVTALDRRDALLVVELDLDRPAGLAREHDRHQHEVDAPPKTERAAARQRHHAHFAQGDAERLVDAVAQLRRRLRGGPDGDLVAEPFGDAGIAADRSVLLAVICYVAFGDDLGFRSSLRRVAPGDHIGVAHITLDADLRGFWPHRQFHVDDMRQQLVLDLDERQRPPGDLLGSRGNGADLVADKADGAVEHLAPPVEPGGLPIVLRHVVMGYDADHAGKCLGPAGVDPDDPRVRVRTAKDLAMRHVLHGQIDAVFERARDFLDGVLDRHALADHGEIALDLRHHTLLGELALAKALTPAPAGASSSRLSSRPSRCRGRRRSGRCCRSSPSLSPPRSDRGSRRERPWRS